MTETDDDIRFLRETFDLARIARGKGHRPFGAIVVEAGEILTRATSTQTAVGDPTGHAEMNAVRAAQAQVSRQRLETSTIYSSSEPCAMCAAAIFYSGIGRIVFGFSEQNLRRLRNQADETSGISIGCRAILAKAPRSVAVVGPLLEEEAAFVHHGFWPQGQRAGVQEYRNHGAPLPNKKDELFLRKAIHLSERARAQGELPFGALVVSETENILVEAQSTEVSEGDWTCHAETNAVRHVGAISSYQQLSSATIYASSEPCAMCASAIFYSGIRRIVFGFSESRLRALLGPGETAGLGLSCREILSNAAIEIDILGPLLQEEAAKPHEGFWSSQKDRTQR